MKSKFSAPDTVVDFHTDVHQQKCSDTTIEKYIRKSSRFPRTATMTKRLLASSLPGEDGSRPLERQPTTSRSWQPKSSASSSKSDTSEGRVSRPVVPLRRRGPAGSSSSSISCKGVYYEGREPDDVVDAEEEF